MSGIKEKKKKTLIKEEAKEKKSGPKEEKVKKPLSAFMLYCNARRPQVKIENPRKIIYRLNYTINIELPMVEISKAIADDWNNLPQDHKQVSLMFR